MNDYGSNLWMNQDGYGASAPRLDYLTDEQNCLAERIRIGRMLYKGQHKRCYLFERRTQWNFPDMKVLGRVQKPYAMFNLLKRFSNTLTDLLLGETPIMRSDENQEALDALSDRSDLGGVIYDASRESSWASQGVLEALRWDGQVYVQNVPPGELFPVGRRNPDGQYTQYKRFAVDEVTIQGAKQKLLLETTYSPGEITRELYKLDGSSKKDKLPDLWLWPTKGADGSALPDREATGIDWNTIIWLPNQIEEGQAVSDYDDSSLIELQDELNAKNTQIGRVLAKHADPKLAAPQSAAMTGGTLFSDHDVFFFRSKDEIPTYVTWNAELASAFEDRAFVVDAMCIAGEVAQILLGLKKGATPDAARKLRLEATPTLARVKRKARYVIPFIKQVIDTAVAMENAARVVKVSMSASVQLRDGLPVDELDEANAISIMTAGKQVMPVEEAVQRRVTDPEEASRILGQIKKEQADAAALAMPASLFGEPSGSPSADQTQTQTQAEAA